jgi:hypothetical protein
MKERAAFMCIVNFPYEQTAPLMPSATVSRHYAVRLPPQGTTGSWVSAVIVVSPVSSCAVLPHSSISECSLGGGNDSNH